MSISRVYRGLFVYTQGFHSLMKTALNERARKSGVALNVWKVFTLLLEQSGDSEHKLLLGDCNACEQEVVIREYKEDVDRAEEAFIKRLEHERQLKMQLSVDIEKRQAYVKELEQEKEVYQINKKRMQEEVEQCSKSNADEIELRFRFETKLNSIYSVYRDLQKRVVLVAKHSTNVHS